MSFRPLVSIVIPVYNGANYMREAIDSALAQTYTNIEVIVVNDGSRDDGQTDKIARSYGDKIRYFSKENGGCASALNLGIANMKGDYFSWLSHDDVYYPEKVARQVALLGALPDKNTIMYGGYEVINEKSESLYFVRPESRLTAAQRNIPLLPLLRGLVHGCALLIPTKYFREIGVFDENRPSTQDYALWFKFFRVAPLNHHEDVLVRSRVHPDQGTHKISKHLDECNDLWIGFLDDLTNEEMTAMEGSRYLFLKNTATFLRETPYDKAQAYAEKLAERTQSDTLVSVIIPVFNRIAWAIESVQSVLAQTHQKFEILIIDDGSTDDVTGLLDFIRTDPRIQYHRTVNQGPAAARNAGVQRAAGEYIAFLDSDDLFYPKKLETQIRFMQETGLRFSHTSYQRMDIEGNVTGSVSSGTFTGNVFPGIIASCPIAMPTVMGSTTLFRRHPFPEHIGIGEDCCLWILIASQNQIGGLDEVHSKVRIGDSTAAFNPRKQALGLISIAQFAMAHSHLGQFSRHIKSLLADASRILDSQPEPGQVSNPVIAQTAKAHGLLAKSLDSLRRDGLRSTYHRVRRRLG